MGTFRQSNLTFALVLVALFTLLPPTMITAEPHRRSDSAPVRDRPSTGQSPAGAILGPDVSVKSTPNYSFRDDFYYSNMSEMQSAGWSECGSPGAYASDYRVTRGVLTLVTDYDNGTNTAVCWDKIPSGISNWSVSTRGAWVEGIDEVAGTIQIVATTTSHTYAWAADGFFQRYILWRDGWGNGGVWTGPLYQAQLGVWHDLRMDFVNGVFHLYFDELLMADVPVQDTGTNLTSIVLQSPAGVDNSFAYVSANAVDPNAADFTLVAGPASQNIAVGNNASLTLSLASVNGFSGPVSLATTVTPGGPNSVTVNPLSLLVSLGTGGSANSNLTISTQSVTSASTFDIRINATSGSLFHSKEVTASVTGPTQGQTFTFAVIPGSLILRQSGTGAWTTQNITVTLSGVYGFTGTVALSVNANNPIPGPVAAIEPSQILIEGNKTFTATVYFTQTSFVSGTWYVSITATTAGISQSTSVAVDFVPSYFYTGLTPSGNVVVPVGSSSSVSLNLVSQNGYAGTVSLSYWSIYALPTNPPTVSFSSSPVTLIPNATNSVQVILSADPATPTGSYGFVIRANGGWSMEDTQISVYVVDHQVSPGVSAGTSATYNVTLSSLPGDSITVVVTVTEVSGPTVYFTQTLYVDNVLINSTAGSIDVAAGTQTGTVFVPFPFVSTGLRVGDQLFPAATYGSIDISSTSTNVLAGMSRSTITGGTGLNIYLLPIQFTSTWDESTGILGTLDGTVPVNSTTVTAHYLLVDTNAWNGLSVEFHSPAGAPQLSTITFTSFVAGGTSPYSYEWSFGDGQTSTQADPVHLYLMPGNYQVTLKVIDGGGVIRSQTSVVKITGSTIPSPFPRILLLSSDLLILGLIGVAVYASIALSASFLLIMREREKQRRLARQSVAN